MVAPIWIDFLMGSSGLEGVGTGRTWTHKEIQERIYDGIGIDGSMAKPFSKKRSEMTFNEECLRRMDEDEFYSYFTDDPEIMDEDEPKSSFLEASKKMKVIEDKQKIRFTVDNGSVGHKTYESYLKSTTPKSSFKDLEKKIEDIKNAHD